MSASSPALVDPADLRSPLTSAEPPLILVVRTPGKFESLRIAGANNVPLDLLREHRDEIRAHPDDGVVLVCRSGQRATQAEELRSAGLTNVGILVGGMNAVEANGFTVNRGALRWNLERQVRLVAGAFVAVAVLASIFVPGLKWLAFAIGSGPAGNASR